MTTETEAWPSHPAALMPEKATALALRLAHAEHALLALTSGQVDAIVNPSGQTYLLRPAQEHLRQRERRLQGLIDGLADVVTVVNSGGIVLSQDGAVFRVFGYARGELTGSRFFELVHEDHLAGVHFAFLNIIEGFRTDAVVQFSHRARDGSHRLVEATLVRLRGSSEVVFTMRPVFNSFSTGPVARVPPPAPDVSTEPVRDHFLAMLSHELRTPLSPARLGLEELLEDERFIDARPLLTMIRRNLDTQARLLEELSDFTTVGQHKVRLRLEPIDAHETIGFVLEICRSELAAAQIEVLLYLRAEERIVQADSVRLQQVLWNLVKNAVKFSTPGSSISIATWNEAPGRLVIEVADLGIGIEPELLPLVFDAFKQGHPLQQFFGGLGLGLFIARGLAEAQGGTLSVESKGRGQGTAFRLVLTSSRPAEVTEKVVSLGLSHLRGPEVADIFPVQG